MSNEQNYKADVLRMCQIMADDLTAWLMDRYECCKVPMAAYPDGHSSIDIVWDKQIPLQLPDGQKWDWVLESIEEPKNIIIEKLVSHRIYFGDELFILEWPMVFWDDTLYKVKKFGWYGWCEVFVKWETLKDK